MLTQVNKVSQADLQAAHYTELHAPLIFNTIGDHLRLMSPLQRHAILCEPYDLLDAAEPLKLNVSAAASGVFAQLLAVARRLLPPLP